LVRATRAVPGPSSIAGFWKQPVLVSSQLDRGSEPRSPPEGLARRRSRASGGTRTRTRPFTGGVLVPSSCTGIGWPAGVEPSRLVAVRVRAGCRRQSACPSVCQSGWLDLNQRGPASDAGG